MANPTPTTRTPATPARRQAASTAQQASQPARPTGRPAAAPAAPPAGAEAAAPAKRKFVRKPPAQFLDVRCKKLVDVMAKLHVLATRWGLKGVAEDFDSAITALKGAREDLQKLPADFKPAPRPRGKYAPGEIVRLRDNIKPSYPEAWHGDLTVVQPFGRRLEVRAGDGGPTTMLPFSDIQAAK